MSRYRRSLAAGGTFFFTVNLADRQSRLLIKQVDRLRRAYRVARSNDPFETIAICVLPNYLHAVWRLAPDDADFGKRWGAIKRRFSTGLARANARTASKITKREKGVWQRRFWRHQIRDEIDLQRHVDYVHFNPVRHGFVKRARDWPYSSFHAYVKKGWLPSDWAAQGEDDAGRFGEPV